MVKVDNLGEIRLPDLWTGANPSVIRVKLSHDHFDKGGFSGAVVADEGDALTPLHLQADTAEKVLVPIGLGDVPQRQHLIPVELGGVEAGVHLLGLGRLCGGAHPLDTLFHGDGPTVGLIHALEGPHPQLLRRLFQLLDLGLLLLVLLHPLLVAAFLLHGIKTVISAVKLRLAVQNFNDTADDAIQKIAVVGNGDHRPLEGTNILFQPLGGVEVQVVGRLVQEQNVRILQNEAAQVDPGLFAAGEAVEKLRPHFLGNGEACGNLVDGHVGVIPTESLKLFTQCPITPQDGRIAVSFRHAALQRPHFLRQRLEARKRGAQYILYRIPGRIDGDLGDQAQPPPGGDGHLALVIIQLSGQNLKERGLASTIFAQQSHPLPLVDLKGQAVQHVVPYLKGFDQSVYLNVNHKPCKVPLQSTQSAWRGTP